MSAVLDAFLREPRIAYFSMEMALRSEIPTYSGGLGVLAGDTMRSAADLDLPMVGVTLASRAGYFRQEIAAGRQVGVLSPWSRRHGQAFPKNRLNRSSTSRWSSRGDHRVRPNIRRHLTRTMVFGMRTSRERRAGPLSRVAAGRRLSRSTRRYPAGRPARGPPVGIGDLSAGD